MDNQKKITVNIPLSTDLNNGLPPVPAQEHIPDFAHMNPEVWDDLPQLLRQCCEKFKTTEEAELFLTGALGVLSGMMPNVQGIYFGKRVSPNLYCFIMGKYGTGKGALTWAKSLGVSIDQYRVQKANDALATHTEEMAHYSRQMKLYDKGKLATPPPLPAQPKHTKLFLPANSTKTALMQLLMENNGRGIIFETEGDTLADMLRQDYGNFSDVLRKAFHHESVSYYRRANNEDVFIAHPALSVVLSGTHDQLRRLIPSIENGLFSRFCFFIMQQQQSFNNPFSKEAQDMEYFFTMVAERMLEMYKRLEQAEMPVTFVLTDEQQQRFVRLFAEHKTEIRRHISDDLDGTVNRLGLICYRIAMILTIVRFPNARQGVSIHCIDQDFNTALSITYHMMQYSLHIYEALQSPKFSPAPEAYNDKQEKICEVCRNFSLGMSVREIALHVLGDKNKRSTVFKWINQFCKAAS